VTIAEFKSTGSNESSFGSEDLAEMRRRKEESRRRLKARVGAVGKKRATRGDRQRGQGAAGG
jgi:hypothetical protein